MANFAVGDIQGCEKSLKQVLLKANFNPEKDTLWACGDVVNRGPRSLETLRFLMSLPSKKVVLGNHDLHLLAVARGHRKLNKSDTLAPILQAHDKDSLLAWVQEQPLIHHDESLGYTMVHAGIPPIWSIQKALSLAKEVESALSNANSDSFLKNMYGNTPDRWQDELKGMERLRVITNCLTRMRFCDSQGTLELETKTDVAPTGFRPWFSFDNPKNKQKRIIFGHWASIAGKTNNPHRIALDTGCVWGGELTLMRLEDQKMFSVPGND